MKITNKDPDFYKILGPVFGSRKVQRITGDRFYDDDKKEWYVSLNENGQVISALSVMNDSIKNIYSEDHRDLETLLREVGLLPAVSIVPNIYKDVLIKVGYQSEECGFKNFIKITGGKIDGSILA